MSGMGEEKCCLTAMNQISHALLQLRTLGCDTTYLVEKARAGTEVLNNLLRGCEEKKIDISKILVEACYISSYNVCPSCGVDTIVSCTDGCEIRKYREKDIE